MAILSGRVPLSNSPDDADVVDPQLLTADGQLPAARSLIDHVTDELDLAPVVAEASAQHVDLDAADGRSVDLGEVSEVHELIVDRGVQVSAVLTERKAYRFERLAEAHADGHQDVVHRDLVARSPGAATILDGGLAAARHGSVGQREGQHPEIHRRRLKA